MKKEKESFWEIIGLMSKFLMVAFVFALPTASAVELDTEITPEEKEKFDEILVPVMKIYNFILYTVSVIAVIALLFAGISYMFSGNDTRKRDTSKHMIGYVIIGLGVIWAAPLVVNLLIL